MSVLFNWALNSVGLEETDSNLAIVENMVAAPLETTKEPGERDREFFHHPIDGLRIYRDWLYQKYSVVYVVEMDRRTETLGFSVELANAQVIGRESISDMASRLKEHKIEVLAGINGSFGIREDGMGRGGALFNLHIQDKELVSVPVRSDWWGFCPTTNWGEASFGTTTDGKFLISAVNLNGLVSINGKEIRIYGINQIRNYDCGVVLFTPKFGRRSLTRGGLEVILTQTKLPITGDYKSKFIINKINENGNSRIPSDGLVLSLNYYSAKEFRSLLSEGDIGTLEIRLLPKEWRKVTNAIGGNIRLLRNGEIESELIKFQKSYSSSAPEQRRGIRSDPRSALGFNDEKLFLVTVDGRSNGYSIGMGFYDLAETLRDLGATEAINFDGGSSATLWGLGKVLNQPSSGYERSVFNTAYIHKID